MTINGYLRSIKSRIDASSDLVNVIVIETNEDVSHILALMKKSLVITMEEKK